MTLCPSPSQVYVPEQITGYGGGGGGGDTGVWAQSQKDDCNAGIYTFSVLKLLFYTVAEAREP